VNIARRMHEAVIVEVIVVRLVGARIPVFPEGDGTQRKGRILSPEQETNAEDQKSRQL
jgi:hypothetical protein